MKQAKKTFSNHVNQPATPLEEPASEELAHNGLAGRGQTNEVPLSSGAASSGLCALEDYDLVILGDGTGSTLAAWTFAGQGQRVAVIERKYMGGSCPNIACLPSKNILHSAKVAAYVRRSAEFGIAVDGYRVDMAGVRTRKRTMVSHLNDVYRDHFTETGAEFILGTGRFVGPRTLEVVLAGGGTRRLRGANVIVSTGTRPALGRIPGIVEARPLTHVEALELDRVPEHLIVVGGGYVGIELSQAMRRFGSKVTVVDRNDRLLHGEDDDVTEALASLFKDEGIDTVLGARIIRVSGTSGESVTLVAEQAGRETTLTGTHLLVAAGRTANTENIGLELAGVAVNERGYIKVNERLETTAGGVWAIGEVAGSPHFTHVSVDDFRVVRDNLLKNHEWPAATLGDENVKECFQNNARTTDLAKAAKSAEIVSPSAPRPAAGALTGGNRVTTGRLIPYTLFTDPELAHIGLSEKQARAQGIAYRLFKIPMEGVLRAHTLAETRGFLKALVDVSTDRILGFTAFAVDGGEILASVQTAMMAGMPYTALREAIWCHPTLAEGLIPLFSSEPSLPEQTGPRVAERVEDEVIARKK